MGDPYDLLAEKLDKMVENITMADVNRIIIFGIITTIILLLLYIGFVFLVLKIKKNIFAKLEKKQGKNLTLQFIERAVTLTLIVVFIVLPLGGKHIARSLLGSTAVVAAVVGFASQEAVKNICESPLTLNEDKYDESVPNGRCVYFLSLEDSSLIMGATVLFPSHFKSEVVKDEINSKVFKALKAGGIEIPYNKLDVNIMNQV